MNGVAKGYRQTSKRPAAPMPPPMHIVTCVRRGVGAARGN